MATCVTHLEPYHTGKKFAPIAADAVKFMGGVHTMSCQRCHVSYGTTKKAGEEGYIDCVACRTLPQTCGIPPQTWMTCQRCKGSYATTKQPGQKGYGLCASCRMPSEPGQGMMAGYQPYQPPQSTTPQSTHQPGCAYHVDQVVHVKRSSGEWQMGQVSCIDGTGTVTVSMGGLEKQIPPFDQVNLLRPC